MPRLSAPMTAVAAIVAVLALAEVAVAARLVATHSSPVAAPSQQQQQQRAAASGHPCNHGYYVSQAAHSKHGGQDVGKVARSDAGKNGVCTKP